MKTSRGPLGKPENDGFQWDHKGRGSPYYNSIVIEARLQTTPNFVVFRRRRPEGHKYAWGWFYFRSIYRVEEDHYTCVSPKMWMKVIAHGDLADHLYTARKHDLLRVEGWLTVSDDWLKRPHIAIAAKKIDIDTGRPAGWMRSAERNRRAAAMKNPHLTMNQILRMDADRERAKLIEKGLIKPSLRDAVALMPDDVPEIPIEDLDTTI